MPSREYPPSDPLLPVVPEPAWELLDALLAADEVRRAAIENGELKPRRRSEPEPTRRAA